MIDGFFSWLDLDWVSAQFADGDATPFIVWTVASFLIGFATGRAWRDAPVSSALSSLSQDEMGAVGALFDVGYMHVRDGEAPDVFERLRCKGIVSVEVAPYVGSTWILEKRFRSYLSRHKRALEKLKKA